jgi:HK97 family phage prohead protease
MSVTVEPVGSGDWPANPATPETAERPFLVRSFDAVAVEVEGRTVDVRVVPFGEVARVADPPDWEPYEEEWLPGCFDHQLNAANRIHANYEHMQGPTHVVGHGVSLRSEADGYHLTSTIHRTNAGDTTLELLNAGALPCVSLEARAVRNVKAGNVIQRAKANLRGFAFCRQGAFVGAQVLAVRADDDEPEQTLDAGLLPVDIDPERVERLRAQGFELPSRYMKAHPAAPGTPDDSGTPDDGTRQTDANQSSEVRSHGQVSD